MKDSIVLYPSAGRSHLVSITQLAKLILTHYPSFSLIIIISKAPFETTSTLQYIQSISPTLPSKITFHHLPTVSSSAASNTDMTTLFFEFPEQNNPSFRQALLTLSKSSNIKAVILDFFCHAAYKISTSLQIPTFYYFPSSLTSLTILLFIPTLHKNSTKSLKDLGDQGIEIPGLPIPIPAKDLPHGIQDRTSKSYKFFLETATLMSRSPGVIVNSVETLEKTAFNTIVEGKCSPGEPVPRLYCLGPLIVSSSSDQVRHECMNWLDAQQKESVVYISFGSLGRLSADQLKEMALGLERSGVRFLWVVRHPEEGVDDACLNSLLPEGFLERTNSRGFVVNSWAPQVEVLSHDSVAGFVTHCGWNSILEGIRAGVPMLSWPLFGEQKMNEIALVEEWKVALPLVAGEDGLVSANEMEKRVTELMNTEVGKWMRERVAILSQLLVRPFNEASPSRIALAKLVRSIQSSEEKI